MMNKFAAGLITGACILSLAAGQAFAEDRLDNQKLRANDMGASNLYTTLNGFSHKGDFVYFTQRNPNIEQVRQGYVMELVVIPIANGRFSEDKIRHIPLGKPVTNIDFTMLTPDQKDMIIVTRSGATFAKLNMETGKLETLMEHEDGKPGFRANPEIVRAIENKMFVKGYFYDGESFSDVDCTATLDPNQKGVLAFDRVYDVELQEAKLKPQNIVFNNTDCAFYVAQDRKNNKPHGNYKLYVWNPPTFKEPTQFDECKEFVSFWGSTSRMAYTVQKPNNLYQLAIYDAKTQKKTIIADDTEDAYKNIFLSEDGSTVLCTDTKNRVGRATYYYADESTGWKLRPTADIGNKTVRFGVTRLSDDGRYFVVYSKRGLDLYRTK